MKIDIPPIRIRDKEVENVTTYNLLGVWIVADLIKWVTDTEYISKN